MVPNETSTNPSGKNAMQFGPNRTHPACVRLMPNRYRPGTRILKSLNDKKYPRSPCWSRDTWGLVAGEPCGYRHSVLRQQVKLSNKGRQLLISIENPQRSSISNWRTVQDADGRDLNLHRDWCPFAVKDCELQDERGRDWDVRLCAIAMFCTCLWLLQDLQKVCPARCWSERCGRQVGDRRVRQIKYPLVNCSE